MRAIMFGSIGVLAETSDLQRLGFNDAFREAGLDWSWSPQDYRAMLRQSGGQDRIARYAAARGVSVDAPALHAAKTRHFLARLAGGVPLRPGVARSMAAAEAAGLRLALVSTTAAEVIAAVLAATGLDRARFAAVLDAGAVARGKPAPDAYNVALARLGLSPAEALAVEDNPDGFAAARAAGLPCIAFPGALHDASGFAGVLAVQAVLRLPPPFNPN